MLRLRHNPVSDAPNEKGPVPETPWIPFETLLPHEVAWRDKQPFLESVGYMLRPRLRPGWVPSWRTSGKSRLHSEDAHPLHARDLLVDATRISDGKRFCIKQVKTGDLESQIALRLRADHIRDDPRNHSVPVLEIFPDREKNSDSYMVMPFLRLMDSPPFQSVGEIMDFADQILEGLVFMHEQGVAHRDCSEKNIMMNADAMYPLGFHPVRERFLPDASTPAIPIPRSIAGVKYYFVDYGISSYIPPGQPKLRTGTFGRDDEVPELSDTIPYDPFKVDIFSIGNVFRREIYDKFSNVEFLTPLIEYMVEQDPADRPTAFEALQEWQIVRREVSSLHRSWRLKPRGERWYFTCLFDTVNFIRSTIRFVKWITGRT